MKITMTQREKQCIDYAERFKRNWEFYCLVKDSYLAGYKAAQENIEYNGTVVIDNGDKTVEVEINDGDHQISQKSVESPPSAE